ncbi:MAG: TM2 domain-containing protein [Bacteroidales bacterium]
MKQITTLLAIIFISALSLQAGNSSYQIDDASVDAMFESAEVVDLTFFENNVAPIGIANAHSEAYFQQEKDPLVAFLLSWFLGYLGIHRAYLGTSTGTIVGYILTLGGCGIIATIDWVMLLIGLINDDISQYVDNPKFFMW